MAPLPSRLADTGAIVRRGAPRGRLSTASLPLGPSVGAEGWRLPRPTCSHPPTPDPASSRASCLVLRTPGGLTLRPPPLWVSLSLLRGEAVLPGAGLGGPKCGRQMEHPCRVTLGKSLHLSELRLLQA